MIAKVVRGWHPAGLVTYLFGPGRHEEHRNPRVVAAWDGAPWLHQPDRLHSVALDDEVLAAGEFDLDLRQLIRTMRGPLQAAGLPANGLPQVPAAWAAQLRAGGRLPSTAPGWLRHYVHDARTGVVVARPGPVWHCSVRLHPGDPTLPDEQWEHIASRLMRATGIHEAGCRWIAVRHADDHIHLMATLVSEDTGKRVHPYRDFPKLRTECQRLEGEFGLMPTASADRTAVPAPTRAELEVARRLGRERTLREDLRLVVAQCAATSSTSGQFLARLTKEGLDPRVVRDEAGQVCGYSVRAFGYRTRSGAVLRFAGRSLAPDLSWTKLQARWAMLPAIPLPQAGGDRRLTGREVAAALGGVAATVERAIGALRDGAGRDLDPVAYAAGEVLAALSHGREGACFGPVTAVFQRYDRAARTPHRVLPGSSAGVVAAELRHAARQLGALGVLTGRFHERFAMTALLLALASLVAEIAAWQQLLNRPHQAAAAASAAEHLPVLASAAAGPPGTARSVRAAGAAPAAPAPAVALPSPLSAPTPDWARPALTGMPASNPAPRGLHR